MLILTNTLTTFDNKVNKIKSLAKKKYYLQETLKKINERIELDLWYLNKKKNEYIEMKAKYPTARDSETLRRIKRIMRDDLPKEKRFKSHLLTLLAELEHVKNGNNWTYRQRDWDSTR